MGKLHPLSIKLIMFYLAVATGYTIAGNQLITYSQAYEYGESRLIVSLPELKGWYDSGNYLEEKADEQPSSTRLYKINAGTGESTIFLDYASWSSDFPEGFRAEKYALCTQNYNIFLYEQESDLYCYQPAVKNFKRLTSSPEPELNATFSADGKKLAFTRQNDLYVIDINSGEEIRLTFDASATVYNGYAAWVYYEEILGRSSKYKSFWWSPTSDRIAFMRFDEAGVPEFPLFCADGVHGHLEMQRYPKAGDPVPHVRLGVIDISSGGIAWADSGSVTDAYLGIPLWLADGSGLIIQRNNRRQNNLNLFLVDPVSGKSRNIYQEEQPAWVEFFDDNTMRTGADGIFLVSERSGWPGIIYLDPAKSLFRNINTNRIRTTKINYIDESNKRIYFQGWTETPAESHLFRVDLKGNDPEQLTLIPGSHACTVSPNGGYFYDRYSNITQPDKIDLCSDNGGKIRTIGDSKSDALDEINLGKTELFSIPTSDGIDLPAMWILPPDFDPEKKYPVLFNVYGGPGRNSVGNNFQRINNYYLAQYGLIIINVDHRGSGKFGKAGSDKMYHNLGKYELDDLIEAVKWLRKQSFIDSSKIAITGASYGGYVACLALTRGADYFTHGLAYYSVTDWQLYDAVYTERFMDLPVNNPAGYEYGSVLTHASNYKGNLLLIHGSMDDNVHTQNSIQLVDQLTELDRDFEFVLIPDSRHGTSRSKRKFMRMKYLEYVFKNLLEKKWPGWEE